MWLCKKISSRYRRLLIYDVKRTTKINGMGPFKIGVITWLVTCVSLKMSTIQAVNCNER